jgi:uncharacterized damage-inducible protein DinB
MPMSISQALVSEFDQEMKVTRKVLERVPEAKFAWKPHERSMAFGKLAIHIAEMLAWVKPTFETDSFDFAPPGGEPYQPMQAESQKQLLEFFDASAAAARAAIATATDQQMLQPWALLQGGKELFRMPRIAVVRGMFMNHIIHHRGQLSVYLRLNDIPVPSLYGPSADESA